MRVLLGVAGVLLLLAGLVAGGVAAWASAVFGADGVLRYDVGTIVPAPGTIATIVDVDRFDATVPYIDALGTTSLSVASGDQGDPSDTLFLGAAETTRVDAYVKGSAYSVGIRDGGEWVVRSVPGAAALPLPRSQDLWIVDDVGRRASIQVPQTRPLTLVLMHPSGIPSGPLVLSVDFTVPRVGTLVTWLLVAAAALILLGVLLVILAVRRRRGPGRHRPEAVVTEDVATEDVATEAVATEAVATEAVATEAVATEDVATEDVVTEDVVTEDVVTEDVVTEDVATDAPGSGTKVTGDARIG